MVFANPVEEAMVSGAYYDQRSVSYYLAPAKLESDYAPVRFERELRVFRKFCPRGDVLDVGCSTGGFLFRLNQTGPYTVTGLDVAGPVLDYAARQGLEVVRTPFLECDFGARRFDAITFWAVFEHLVEPAPFLEHAARWLRPGGHCFILAPNLRSLAHRLLGPKYRYVLAEHVNYFSAATLCALVERVDTLTPVRLYGTHFNPVVLWQDWQGRGDFVPDQHRAQLLRRTTRLKQASWLWPVKMAYAGVEGLLGATLLADNLLLVLQRRLEAP